MAFTSEDEVKQALTAPGGQPAGGIDPTSYTPGGGSGSQFISGPGQSAPGGASVGGSKPFVNIQSYLAGNKPTESEGNVLRQDASNIVGGEFGRAQGAQTQAKAQGETERAEKIGVPQATQIIQNAAQGQGDTSAVKNSLAATYDKPQFDYTTGQQFAGMGENLNAQGGFRNYANQAYGREAGGSLSSGQRLLQQQLDVLNPYVQQAETGIKDTYGKVKTDIGGITDDVGKYMSELEDYYMKADSGLRSGLDQYGTGQYNTTQAGMNQLNERNAAAAREYQNAMSEYTNLVSGFQNQFKPSSGVVEGPRTSWGAPKLNLPVDKKKEFLSNVETMDKDSLLNYFKGLGGDPFGDQQLSGPWSSVRDAYNIAKGTNYTAGEDYTMAGVNNQAVSEYNLIRELLGGDKIDTTSKGKKATFTKRTPGLFEY
jgi:hypothetical protein